MSTKWMNLWKSTFTYERKIKIKILGTGELRNLHDWVRSFVSFKTELCQRNLILVSNSNNAENISFVNVLKLNFARRNPKNKVLGSSIDSYKLPWYFCQPIHLKFQRSTLTLQRMFSSKLVRDRLKKLRKSETSLATNSPVKVFSNRPAIGSFESLNTTSDTDCYR